jgi:short-subunit dehydrogenase
MTRIAEKTVLVTGGARGMGRMFAEGCLKRGAARVALWDIDAEGLERTASEIDPERDRVTTAVVDVSNAESIERQGRELLDARGAVGILFNNAGIVVGKPFADHSSADIERTIRINVQGPMHVARVFLPAMLSAGAGHVVNIASAAGLTPNPNMSVYAASKWAVLGWSESLRIELEATGPGLKVTTVCPSYVDTGMFHGARAPVLTRVLSPDAFVNDVLDAVEQDKILLRRPKIVNLMPFLRGALPTRLFDRVVGRGLRIYNSMDEFEGHGPSHGPSQA